MKAAKARAKRGAVPTTVKQLVLHESGYKCANPSCRHVVTLDVHHLRHISKGGGNGAENLLPLCPNCHSLHHRGVIPEGSLRSWKMLLLSLNEAFDRKTADILLALDKQKVVHRLTGDGIIDLAPLLSSGMIDVREYFQSRGSGARQEFEQMYCVELSSKGKAFVESWKQGDQTCAVANERIIE